MSLNKKIRIVTHDSKFHTDDVFAVATLSILIGDENVEIIRSRLPEVIATGDYVVDTGFVYDESNNRFDHHQPEGAGMRNNGVPYASFGLVWKKYGEKVSGSAAVADLVDHKIIQQIDARDNGIQVGESKIHDLDLYDLEDLFRAFNPGWNETSSSFDETFLEAVNFAKQIILREIARSKGKIEARIITEKIYSEAKDKRIIVLDYYLPTDDVLSKYPEPLFVVYPRIEGNWGVKAVVDDEEAFDARKYLPESWAGEKGRELEKISGVKGAAFCHRNRHLGTAVSKEAAIKMAEIGVCS